MNLIEALEGIVSGKLQIIKTIMQLVKLEAKLAGQSIVPLVLNICMLLGISFALWGLSMVLLGYFIKWYFDSTLVALLSLWVLNLACFSLLLRYLKINLTYLSFEKTRQYFTNSENSDHDKFTQKINDPNFNPGKKLTLSTKQSKKK